RPAAVLRAQCALVHGAQQALPPHRVRECRQRRHLQPAEPRAPGKSLRAVVDWDHWWNSKKRSERRVLEPILREGGDGRVTPRPELLPLAAPFYACFEECSMG